MPVRSFIKNFRHEFEHFIQYKRPLVADLNNEPGVDHGTN